MMKRLLTLILSLCLFSALAAGQTKPAKTSDQPASAVATTTEKADPRVAEVDALMARFSTGETPGAAILVVRDGRVLLKKGYGLANVETKEPIRPDTVFDLASVSKQFTAMAVMMLVERGKLSLDDPLTKFYPEFPAYAQKITVRHLLTHTGGLPDYMELFIKQGKISADGSTGGFEPTSADTVHLLAEQKEPRFAPGEKWEYSNSGYVVLGQIVGKAAGKPLPQFLKENVFGPLGMTSTLVADESRPKIARRAISYAPTADGKFENADYTPLNLIYGDGNVNTTIEDLFLWDQALYTAKLVKAATLRQAFTSSKLVSGKETGYGYGWLTGKYGGLETVSHAGGWAGFRTELTRFPQERFTVVVLSNFARFSPTPVARRVARIYLADKLSFPVVKVEQAVLQKYVGKYELRPGFILNVTLEDGTLRAQATGQGKNTLVAKSEVDFYLEEAESISLTFNKDEKGQVTGLTLHQGGDHVAKKIE